ncbi:hypothetical protein ACO2Q3_15590 [Caulobacter sp. KR2-114]|uniref:hypothetical protein n=1 Tax=Caulobacter sp. KR2-114 TaxID=3400912 RepID=UPI003C09D086
MAGRPKARMVRVLSAAAMDTARRGLAVVPMAAGAFAGPWAVMFEIDESVRGVALESNLLMLAAMIGLGGAMQSLLLALGAADLGPVRARWRADAWTIARRLGVDLGLNLTALVLVCLAAVLLGVAAGVAVSMLAPTGDAGSWAALVGAIAGGVLAAFLLARWALATAAAHVEDLGVVEALQRSAELTRGHRLKIAAVQALYLCAWPGLFFAAFYLSEHAAALGVRSAQRFDQASLEAAFTLLGVLAGYESFAKVRLYREVATMEGEVGQARVLEVFA